MSDLIAVAYPDEERAAQVLAALRRLQAEYLIDLEDAVYVTKGPDGKPRLHQAVDLTREGAVSGAWWGLLIGLLVTLPFPFMAPAAWLGIAGANAAVGAGLGALSGHYADVGVDDAFVERLGEELQPGSSVLFVLVRRATPDRVLAAVQPYGGTVLRTSLSAEAEARLRQALATGQTAGQSGESEQPRTVPAAPAAS